MGGIISVRLQTRSVICKIIVGDGFPVPRAADSRPYASRTSIYNVGADIIRPPNVS